MDTRKVTLVAVIAAIALVAAGIGYAYTASTSNSENNTGMEYVVLKPSANGTTASYNGALTEQNNKVTWNTVNQAGSVTFTLANGSSDVKVAGYQKVGSIYLLPDYAEAKDDTKFQLKVSATGTSNDYNYKLVFGYGANAAAAASNSALNATEDSGHDDAAVKDFSGSEVTYTASTAMIKSNATVMIVDIYVKPNSESSAFTNVAIASIGNIPDAITNGTFTFTLESYVPSS